MVKCILITGMGHSGTRLLVQMLSRHPQVSVPFSILNRVKEYTPLHEFFIQSIDSTPLESPEYIISYDELKKILQKYMTSIDHTKDYFVLKLPYYPLNCLDFLVDFFKRDIVLVFVKRPLDKVIKSFIHRGEDKSLFLANEREFIRQIKKLNVSSRRRYFQEKNFPKFIEELYQYTETKRDEWNKRNPQFKFVEIDIEQSVSSREYLSRVLQSLGLSDEALEDMLSVVNKNRLLLKFTGRLRSFLAPFVWPLRNRLFVNRGVKKL